MTGKKLKGMVLKVKMVTGSDYWELPGQEQRTRWGSVDLEAEIQKGTGSGSGSGRVLLLDMCASLDKLYGQLCEALYTQEGKPGSQQMQEDVGRVATRDCSG